MPIVGDHMAAARLLCIPGAGGGVAAFRSWRDPEGSRSSPVRVSVVRLPGRETRYGEPVGASVIEVVDQLIREVEGDLDRPYAVFGHCSGALIAYEFARRIEAEGTASPLMLFVAGRRAPHWRPTSRMSTLSNEELVEVLVAGGALAQEVADNAELLALVLPAIRADLALEETYAHSPGAPLGIPLVVISAETDNLVPIRDVRDWEQYTASRFSQVGVPGDHFGSLRNGREWCRIIIEEMSREMVMSEGLQ